MQWFLKNYALTLLLAYVTMGEAVAQPLDRYGEAEQASWAVQDGENQDVIPPEEASKHIGKLVSVKGRVLSQFETREDRYLNFGEDYKTDFTIRIPRRAWKFFGELEGKELTVRGVIRQYNGPMIVVDKKEQIHENTHTR